MALLGDKISCRAMAKKAGTPIFPGSEEAIEEEDEARDPKDTAEVPEKPGKQMGECGFAAIKTAGMLSVPNDRARKCEEEGPNIFGNGLARVIP